MRQTMVDAREQIHTALAALDTEVPYTLRGRYPKGMAEGNVITWGEYSNVSTDCPVVDQITFQVDLWTRTPEERRALAEAVNRAMCGIGLRRTYAGMDGYDENTGGYYRKTFRFGRKVDKRWGRLMD